jgi:hypothetical protein
MHLSSGHERLNGCEEALLGLLGQTGKRTAKECHLHLTVLFVMGGFPYQPASYFALYGLRGNQYTRTAGDMRLITEDTGVRTPLLGNKNRDNEKIFHYSAPSAVIAATILL